MITKDMVIGNVLEQYPEAFDIFMQHGMGCMGCSGALFESIEQGAMAHGLDLDSLMADLNALAASAN